VLPPGEPTCEPACFGCADIADTRTAPYPPIDHGFAPTLSTAPVTRHAEFPSPLVVGRAQARSLRGLPDRSRQRMNELLAGLANGPLTDTDTGYLTTLFGTPVLNRLKLVADPPAAVRTLLARFDVLLASKLARLDQLIARAIGRASRLSITATTSGRSRSTRA